MTNEKYEKQITGMTATEAMSTTMNAKERIEAIVDMELRRALSDAKRRILSRVFGEWPLVATTQKEKSHEKA